MAEGIILRLGEVTNVNDPYGAGRIQVRTTFDNTIAKNEDLPFYSPLLPKMLHIVPKVGELVLVLAMAADQFHNSNFYIGPIISQEDKLFFENKRRATAQLRTGYLNLEENPHLKQGVLPTLYPATEDIAIEGRKDTGIQLKDEEVRIKAGVKVVNWLGPKNNTVNPAFISLKYYPKNDPVKDGFKSTATIVADKINLIGTHTTDPKTSQIPVTQSKDTSQQGKDNLISDAAMKALIESAHKLPYGDKLVEFLDLLRTAFAKHVHPFPTMAPCNDENMKTVATYELENILSDNVRIN